LRQDTKYFEMGNPFNRELKEKILIEFLLEMIQKSGSLLSMVSASKQEEELKILEMSL
jgi:hypothetical protein